MFGSTADQDAFRQRNPDPSSSRVTVYPCTGVPLACTGRTTTRWVAIDAWAGGLPTPMATAASAVAPRAKMIMRRIGAFSLPKWCDREKTPRPDGPMQPEDHDPASEPGCWSPRGRRRIQRPQIGLEYRQATACGVSTGAPLSMDHA